MALIADIIAKEVELEDKIILYKEGIFWKAYQYSAYRILKHHSNFKVKKRFVKTVSCEVVSLGFPEVTLNRLFLPQEQNHIDDKTISIACKSIEMINYTTWFESIPLDDISKTKQIQLQTEPACSKSSTVIQRIKEFSVEQSTPMECMNFIIEIRKELSEDGNI